MGEPMAMKPPETQTGLRQGQELESLTARVDYYSQDLERLFYSILISIVSTH